MVFRIPHDYAGRDGTGGEHPHIVITAPNVHGAFVVVPMTSKVGKRPDVEVGITPSDVGFGATGLDRHTVAVCDIPNTIAKRLPNGAELIGEAPPWFVDAVATRVANHIYSQTAKGQKAAADRAQGKAQAASVSRTT